MRFFKATLIANSHLYFYSTEFLKTTTVDSKLHNWALMFALNNIKAEPHKRHLENLNKIEFYCTPAVPKNIYKSSFLLNPVPEDTGAGKLGIMRIQKFLPGSIFEFIVMSKNDKFPPKIISYGKKLTTHSVKYDEITVKPEFKDKIHLRTKEFVNPLDFKKIGDIGYALKHPMKPSPLYIVEGTFYDVWILPSLKGFQQIFPANFPYLEWAK